MKGKFRAQGRTSLVAHVGHHNEICLQDVDDGPLAPWFRQVWLITKQPKRRPSAPRTHSKRGIAHRCTSPSIWSVSCWLPLEFSCANTPGVRRLFESVKNAHTLLRTLVGTPSSTSLRTFLFLRCVVLIRFIHFCSRARYASRDPGGGPVAAGPRRPTGESWAMDDGSGLSLRALSRALWIELL